MVKFIAFEYKSQEDVFVVLREARPGGAIDLETWTIPVRELRNLTCGIESFLSLFDIGVIPGQPNFMV